VLGVSDKSRLANLRVIGLVGGLRVKQVNGVFKLP